MRVVGGTVRAGVDQHLRHLGVALDRRPVQGGGAVALRFVDVEALLQQRAHGLAIAVHRRVGDRRAVKRRVDADGKHGGQS
jgi:ABC-type sugar transport system substrate-binding protein